MAFSLPASEMQFEDQEDDLLLLNPLRVPQALLCLAQLLPAWSSWIHRGEDCPQWMVPITISTSEDPNQAKLKILMDRPEMNVLLKNVKPDQWVKLNLGTVGFYRTQYSSAMLESLLPGIRDLSLPSVDRLGLQNDLFSLARAGIISTVEVLKVMEAFVNEPKYTVWSDLSCNLGILSTLLSHTDFYEEIQEFVKDVFSPIGERLGWDPKPGEGHLDALLRGLVLGKLGKAGHKATLEEARRRFKDHVEGKQILSADLRSPVYLTVLKHGDGTTLDIMLKLHKQADMQEEKNRIERVLGATLLPDLIQKVLTFALSAKVRPQDTVSVIGGVAGGSKHGRKAAWKFIKDNWEELYNRYQGGFLISRLIKLSVEGFAVDKMAGEVKLRVQFSTDSRVQKTFEILLDENSEADKREKAANNLIVLGREEAGAEKIFQNNGVALLLQLLDTKKPELVLAAVRTLSGMCSGHRARATVILHAMRIDRICSLMAVENEEMSLAVCNLLQAVIDSLSGEDKREHRGKEEALVLGQEGLYRHAGEAASEGGCHLCPGLPRRADHEVRSSKPAWPTW
nr:puromycin-sensitive aminopeptidase-like [Symphalangus syndactylus]